MATSVGEIEATLRLRDEMTQQLRTARTAVAEFGQSLGQQISDSAYKAAASLKAFSVEQKQVNDLVAKFSGTDAIAKSKQYADALFQVGGASKLTRENQAEVNKVVNEAIAAYARLGQTAPAWLQSVSDSTAAAALNTKELGATLKDLGGSLSRAGTVLSAAITAPLVGAGVAAVKFAGDFESNMLKVETLSGVASKDVEEMKNQVLALAPAVGIGPNALSEALLVVTSTGLRGKEAMEILTASAKSSAVGLGETKDIARALTAAITAYGKESLSAADASDALLAAVREGGAEAKSFATSLGRVIPIAAELGISFNQVLANVATFTRLGISTDLAVTGLRAAIVGLEAPGDKAAEAIKALYGSVDNLRTAIKDKGLAAVMVDLMEKTHGNIDALKEIFPNIRALTNLLGTAGSQGKEYVGVLESVEKSHGDVSKAMEKTKGTFSQQWNELTASIETVAIEFGTSLLPILKEQVIPALKGAADTAKELLDGFNELPTPVKDAALAFAALVAALGPMLIIVGQSLSILGSLTTVLGASGASGVVGAAGLAGTAISTILVPALLAIAVPAALYEVVRVLTLIKELFDDSSNWDKDAQNLANTLKNEVATAARLAGHEFNSYAEAHAFLQQRTKELQAGTKAFSDELLQNGIVVKSVTDAIGAHVSATDKQRAGMAEAAKRAAEYAKDLGSLDAAQRSTLLAEKAHGVSVETLSKEFKVSKETIEQYAKAQAEAVKNVKPHEKAIRELDSALIPLTDHQIEEIKQLQALSRSHEYIAQKVGITKTQYDLYEQKAKAVAATEKQLAKEAIANAKDFAENQIKFLEKHTQYIQRDLQETNEYYGRIEELSLSGTNKQIADIKRLEKAAIDAIKARGGEGSEIQKENIRAAHEYYDLLLRIALQTEDTILIRARAAGFETRDDMKETADRAVVLFQQMRDKGVFTWKEIQDAADRAQKAQLAALDDWSVRWQVALGVVQGILDAISTSSDTAFGKLIASLKVTVGGVEKAIKAYQDFKTAVTTVQKIQAIGEGIAAVNQATSAGSTAQRTIGGAASGAIAGTAILPGLGTIVGAGVGALVGFFRGHAAAAAAAKEANAQIAQYQQQLKDTYGTTEHLAEVSKLFGVDVAAAMGGKGAKGAADLKAAMEKLATAEATANTNLGGILQQLDAIGASVPENLQPFLKHLADIGALTKENVDLLAKLTGDGTVDWQKLQDVAEKYGISLDGLGDKFQAAKLHASAQTIWDDFKLLIDSGADTGAVLAGMSDEISTLVNNSKKFGVDIPENFRPLIQQLIDTGQLIDGNGNKIKSLDGIKFGETIQSSIEKLITKLQEFIDKLGDPLTNAIKKIPSDVTVNVHAKVIPEDGNGDTTQKDAPGFALGTAGRFLDFGTGTLVKLHGKERVTTQAEAASAAASGLSGGDAGNAAAQAAVLAKAMSDQVAMLAESAREFGLDIDQAMAALIDSLSKSRDAASVGQAAATGAVSSIVDQLAKSKAALANVASEVQSASRAQSPGQGAAVGGLSYGGGFRNGTGGRYLDFGIGTQVTLHGKERVMTEHEAEHSGGGGTTLLQPVVIQVDGRTIAEAVVPLIPSVVKRYGLA